MEARIKVEEVRHSKLGASSSERWMNCTGSQNLIAKIPYKNLRKSGPAAAKGTAAHTIGSTCLDNNQDAWEFIGTEITVDEFKFVVDEELAEGPQVYIDFIRQKIAQFPNAKVFIEKDLESFWDKDAFGTADCIIYVPGDRLIVVDYKNGMILIEPSASQLKYYGALALENIVGNEGVKVIELVIVQPNMPHPKGVIRKLVMNSEEVEAWFQNEVIPKMIETRDPNAPLTLGEWCRWCPARDLCPAMKQSLMAIDTSIEPIAMTNEELGLALSRFKMISDRLTQLEGEAFARALQGHNIPGRKLVAKQANRVFRNAIQVPDELDADKVVTLTFKDAVDNTFGKTAYKPAEIMSPPGIEKLVGGKAFVARWAFKPDVGLTMASTDDPRPEAKPLMDMLEGPATEKKSLMDMIE